MIIKFAVGTEDWAYHEADEILIRNDQKHEDHNGSALMYTDKAKGKLAFLRKGSDTNSSGKTIFYSTGYLIDNEGSTINCI